MKIQYPERVEGKVWIQQFNQHLTAWLKSQRQDSAAFEESVAALRHLMEREPDTAGYVANLLSTLVRQHVDTLLPTELERAAKRGLDAIRLISEETELRTLTRCNLLNHLARAYIDLGRFSDALDQAEASCSALVAGASFDSAVAELLEIQARMLSGRAREALLDYTLALSDFVQAEEAAVAIVEDQPRMSKVLISQVRFEFPQSDRLPEEAIRAQIQLLWRQLSRLRIAAAAGAGRCAIMADPDSVDDRLVAIADVSETNGLGDTSAMELALLVCAASPDVAADAVTRILKSVEKLGLGKAEFSGVLYAALSSGAEDPEQEEDYREIAEEWISEIEDPLVRAAIHGLLLAGAGNESVRGDLVDEFLNSVRYLGQIHDHRLTSPAYRMVFDEPVLIALQQLCEWGDGFVPWEDSERILIAKLIDYDFSGLTPIDEWLKAEPTETGLESIADLARDRLARVNCALRNWPDTLALIVRTVKERTLFVALTGEADPVAVISAQTYSASARALADHLDEEISSVTLTGAPGSADKVRELGIGAYDALPDEIRSMIADCQQLLVCPDHRAHGGAVLFELFHDGDEWLGVSRAVARFPNLQALVRCLEGTARCDEHQRLLAIAVPDAEGFKHLRFAEGEAEATRTLLDGRGWDAPQIDEARVSLTFLLNRLPYLTHLHIAAHGEVAGQQESLVLHGGERLSAAELLGRFIPRMPSAYINACELGTSRWAGSGRTQSIPYAFVGSGSRAVIANLLPVEDQISSDLANLFYENAQDLSFGDSLKEARRKLAGDSVHPVFWGSTILIGDPSLSLVEHSTPPSVSEAYLNALVLNREGDDREAAAGAARTSLTTDPEDTRLSASVALLNAINDGEFTPGNVGLAEIAEACRIAFEIDHLPLLGFLVFTASKVIDELETTEAQIKFYDNAINLLEPLEGEGQAWKSMLDELLVSWLRLQRGERLPQIQIHGPQPDDNDDFMQGVKALMDVQLAMEARDIRAGRGPVSRQDESSVENVLWNAVVASREYHLEDMREIYDFARKIVEKLTSLEAIPDGSVDEGTTAFAGLLNWIWRSQNQAQLGEEMIQGQSGVLNELVASLSQPWQGTLWFERLLRFEAGMKEVLDSLEGLPYDDKLYPRIEEAMAEIRSGAKDTLEEARDQNPDFLCESTAWLLGCLIKNNTYSYTDGSVPEYIDKKLTDIHHHFSVGAEGNLYSWLDRGFKSVREAELDELSRWKYGLG